MKSLLSESHYQQQDLKTVKDDLGVLKFGFAYLQHATAELDADSKRQNYKLEKIESTLKYQDEKIKDLAENTTQNFHDLHTVVDDIVDNGLFPETVSVSSHPCGDLEEWVKVIDFDMSDANTTCPIGWLENTFDTLRTCGRPETTMENTCYMANILFNEDTIMTFRKVCGRVRAYASGEHQGFKGTADGGDVGSYYVDGVSLTVGFDHLWTFAAGYPVTNVEPGIHCPCDREDAIMPPESVGNSYFCESPQDLGSPTQYFTNNPLWDGLNCNLTSSCCDYNNPPYFINYLGETLKADGINASICIGEISVRPDIRVEQIELFVAD